MSRKQDNKKSTSKYRKFKVSPLIAITAIIEVVLLVVASTFAWFYMSTNKQVDIGTISVDADSGLDIDFKYAKEEDYINLWNYIDKDFEFEPVTSLDGRNFFVPTSGTFANTNTSEMVFREGTVNDINSKYINIDFELTNTTDFDMKVYLNNNSYFYVKDKEDPSKNDESRALRLAFYPNDASIGKVTSQLIGSASDYSSQENQGSTAGRKTVYFDNTQWSNGQASKKWNKVYAYIWHEDGDNDVPYAAWPGIEMSQFSGPVYTYSFTDSSNYYDKVIFNSGVGQQTGNLNLINNEIYSSDGEIEQFVAKTVYFVKPSNWDHVYVHAWRKTNGSSGSDQYYTSWSGTSDGLDEMQHVGSGIYAYTFNGSTTANNGYYSGVNGLLFTNGSYGGYNQTQNITVWDSSTTVNDNVYYCNGKDNNNVYSTTTYGITYPNLDTKTIYFYNSLGWSIPYINANVSSSIDSDVDIPMTTLNGNVYYCNLPEIYSNIYFKDRDVSANRTYIIPGNTDGITLRKGYVYRTTTEKDGSNYYKVECFRYADYTTENGYAVISPGVSAGFQRTYSPIITINNETGAATEVIPAFSNSIDNYIFGNKAGPVVNGEPTSQTVFEIGAKHMISLSMVIWLEGTDPACVGDTYPGNKIELRLEFASSYLDTNASPPEVHNINTNGSETYKYKFYDKTREVWTSDRKATESGVTVAPVMQLYDNTMSRGYLMSPESYVTVDGKQKVSCWSVDAPQSIALWGHDIIFRRVNPYDEDEVWNYWHAGRVSGAANDSYYTEKDKPPSGYQPAVYSIATAGTTDTISFTAFADGSPTEEMLQDNGNTSSEIANAQLPEVSCGGLWGNHNVRTLTVVDAFAGHYLRDNGGILTMQYNYRYSGGTGVNAKTRDVKIEYKASGPNNTILYYFIVPDVIYTATDYINGNTGLTSIFHRYTGFDKDYAINSDRNDELKYAESFSAGKPTGDYFELSRRSDGSNEYYWGSDLLYVETTNTTKDYCFSGNDKGSGKNKLLQAHFYNGTASGNSKYAYLYAVEDATIKGNAATAFVAVVPNDQIYTGYRIECVDWDYPTHNEKKFFTDGHEVKRDKTIAVSATNGDSGAAKTFYRNYLNNLNICKLDWFRNITIHFQTTNAQLDRRGDGCPYAYLYKGSTKYTWPGEEMTYEAEYDNGSKKKYKVTTPFSVLTYDTVIFNGGDNTRQTNALSLSLSSAGCIYECNNVNGTPGYIAFNENEKNVIESNTWATNNAHFAPNTST